MSPQGPGEAARVAQQLLDAGYSRKQIGQILGRNSSLVSQFWSKGKGASLVPALEAAVRAVQGGVRDVEDLRAIASGYTTRRRTKAGKTARVRTRACHVQLPHPSPDGFLPRRYVRPAAVPVVRVLRRTHEPRRSGTGPHAQLFGSEGEEDRRTAMGRGRRLGGRRRE